VTEEKASGRAGGRVRASAAPKAAKKKSTGASASTEASARKKLAAGRSGIGTSSKLTTATGSTTRASTMKTQASRLRTVKRATPVARRATASAPVAWKPDVRADQIVSVLGNKRAAKILSVSESQPSRWRNAQEVPSPQVAPALVDLDHIIARLQLVWDGEVIGDWLEGSNAFLDGSRPIDVLLVHGSIPVLEAIEAEASGAYA